MNKNVFMLSLALALFFFISPMISYGGSIEVAAPGATPEENSELAQVFAKSLDGRPDDSLNSYSLLIEKHPDNRPARLMRARLLIYLGRITEAKADLEHLAQLSPDFIGLHEMEARLAHAVGSQTKELAAYKAIADEKPSQDQFVQALRPDAMVLQAHIDELSGNQKDAEEAWKQYVNSGKPGVSGHLSEYGDYQVRQGQYDAAIKTFRLGLRSIPKDQADLMANSQIKLAAVLWATGKPTDALEQTLETIEFLTDKAEDTSDQSSFLKPSVLLAYTLTQKGIGTLVDKTKSHDAFEALVAKGLPEKLYGYDIAIGALAGTMPTENAVDQLRMVLKSATYFDDALWAGMYLALNAPDVAGRLKEQLPPGSIQRAIADEYK